MGDNCLPCFCVNHITHPLRDLLHLPFSYSSLPHALDSSGPKFTLQLYHSYMLSWAELGKKNHPENFSSTIKSSSSEDQ